MKSLCVFTLYGEKGASSQYRILMFKDELEKNFQVQFFSFWSDNYITKYTYNKKKYLPLIVIEYIVNVIKRMWQLYIIAPKSDVVFFQKGVIPGIKNTNIKHLYKKRIKIVYDVDDAIFLDKKNNTDDVAFYSNIVICGNENLYSHYSKINKNCIVIPTVENTKLFRPYWNDTFGEKIIGWIGSGVTLHNLDIVIDAINEMVIRHPEIRFHIICNTPGEYLEKIHNSIFIKWERQSYIYEMSRFTIGIMPLKTLDINKGKCGFKLVQCLNMRKPVIATDLGVNSDIINGCGLLASDTDGWIKAFEELLFDEKKYNQYISNIDSSFFSRFDYDKIAEQIIKIIN